MLLFSLHSNQSYANMELCAGEEIYQGFGDMEEV